MRVSLSKNINGNKGIDNFARQLFKELQQSYDVKIVSPKEKSDIHLSIIQGIKKGSVNVLRLDGVYYDLARLGNNKPIAKSMSKADGVIYQSKWCKTFCENMTKVYPKDYTVIWNGVNSSYFSRPRQKNPHGFDRVFVSCSHWRPNKRPEAIAKALIEANKESELNLGLYMVGKIPSAAVVKNDNIIYMGNMKHNDMADLYSMSDYMVHICHIDACPNSVIEGLSSGLPVLCNNISGTPEIVGNSGIHINIDKPFDFKPINNMKLTGSKYVSIEKIKLGMIDMTKKEWNINRTDLDIKVSAKKYYKYFESLL